MAKGLQCPGCGHKHRLDSLPSRATFRCSSCGQMLRNPTRAARSSRPADGDAAPAGSRAADRAGDRSGDRSDRGPDRTAVMVAPPVARRPVGASPRAPRPPLAAPAPAGATPGAAAPAAPAGPAARMPLLLRLLIWVVALPVGGAVALMGARLIGYVDGSRLIDMISGEGWGRFLRVFSLVPVWALLSAGIVQGLEYLWSRRRAGRAGSYDGMRTAGES